MANVWHASAPAHPRSPADAPRSSADQSREGGVKWWIVTLVPVVLVVAGSCVASYVGLRLYDNFTQSLAGIGEGLQGLQQAVQSMQIGGTAANAAANVAAPQPPSLLSISALNAELPKYEWVDGATNVPYSSSRRPIVGVNVVGTDIETAVQPVQSSCSFGLTVTSSMDPLITADHLPGPGTYFQYEQTSQCIAVQAPTSSWQTWSPSDF
jgi:hypothetical protein